MIVITLNAGVEDLESATKVIEIFSRIMAGLAFEGIFLSLNMSDVEITPAVGAEDLEGPS